MERVSPNPFGPSTYLTLDTPPLSPSISRKIPFILMTNGGGIQEKLRVLMLSRQLDFPVSETDYVQVCMFEMRDATPQDP